jgi:Winged helix-turn helix
MWSVPNEQKTPEGLQMGNNPGTIDASAHFIVLEGARCPNASGFSASILKTGKPSSSTRVFPEQTAYELLRPIVLFGDPATKRAEETSEPRPTLERKADAFDEQGMVSFFASRPRKQPQETARSLPPDMRQLIVDLRVELPTMSLREIAEICEARFQRRPSHNSVKMVLASGPPPSIQMRRFPRCDDTPDPAQRRHNIVQLHAEGWSITSIAEYLATSRQTVYTTLKRWVKEGVKGLDDKSRAKPRPQGGDAGNRQ